MKRIIEDEARLLKNEFGAGAALFVQGQLADGWQSGNAGAVVFWTAILDVIKCQTDVLPASAERQEEKGEAPISQPAIAVGQEGRRPGWLQRHRPNLRAIRWRAQHKPSLL